MADRDRDQVDVAWLARRRRTRAARERPERGTGAGAGRPAGPADDRDTVDFAWAEGWLRQRGWLKERTERRGRGATGGATGGDVGGDGTPPSAPADDRDHVDFSWAETWLRRRGWVRASEADRAGRVGKGEQLALFGSPARSGRGRAVVEEDAVAPDAPIRLDNKARVVMAGAVVLYVALFASWTMRHHDGTGTQAFDLGIYDQGIWLLSRFKAPFVTIMGRNLFGDHTSFALLPLVPLYWIWPSAKALLFVQAAAIGVSAIPMFLLARDQLRNELLAAGMAGAFLLQPVIGWTNLEQFHPDVLEIPLVAFAAYFMVKERWRAFLICLGALLLVKEDAVLITVGFGAYVALKHDRRIGLWTIAGSVLYAATAFWVILPALNGVGTLNGWRIPFGGPIGFVKTTLLHPGKVIDYVFVEKRTWYAWQLFAPVGLMALLAPSALFIALPALGSNVVSTFPYQYDIHYHYSTLVAPMIMVATILGIADLGRTMLERRNLVIIVLTATLVTAHLWGPTPLGRHEFLPADPTTAQVVALRQAIQMIPKEGVVSAYYGWVPQVDHRTKIYMFPNPWKASYWGTFKQEGQRLAIADTVDWVLLPQTLDPEPKAVFDSMQADFDKLVDHDGVMLLRRRAPSLTAG